MAASTLHSSARARDKHVHLDSASASHRGAAASLLGQSELARRLRCKVTTCRQTSRTIAPA